MGLYPPPLRPSWLPRNLLHLTFQYDPAISGCLHGAASRQPLPPRVDQAKQGKSASMGGKPVKGMTWLFGLAAAYAVTAHVALSYPLFPDGVAAVWLIGNAWKYTGNKEGARIAFYSTPHNGGVAYVVEDNGVGFDTAYANKLFGAF